MTIPLSAPSLNGNELNYIKQCIETGWISSAGQFVSDFEGSVKKYVGSKNAIACMNGTAALQTCLNVLNVSSGDIIITTNLTFVATLNAISYTGAKPILFDIDEQTWQIDLDLVHEWLADNTYIKEVNGLNYSYTKKSNSRIAAIVPVHVLGGLVDIEKLIFISKKFYIPIVEDSTEALGSTFKSKSAGSFGELGAFSFNGNKIISTGGGGMIVTNNEKLAQRAKHLTTTAKTDPLDYYHDEVGYNFRLVNILAAVGVAQMEYISKILEKKRRIDSLYREGLGENSDFIFQKHIKDSKPNCWLFTFRAPKMRSLLNFLNSKGIQSRPFWTPMNRLPMHSNIQYINNFDVTGRVFSECISIPSSSNLTEGQQADVLSSIKKFYKK